jgi:phosphoribosyl-ATP pyrophosphohydrolase
LAGDSLHCLVSVPFAPAHRYEAPVNDSTSVLARLMALIEDRKAKRPEKSYTTELLAGGLERIGAKILEEAAEVVVAAAEPGDDGRAHTIAEAADLVYHLLVLLGHRDISLAEVEAELARRFGVSGIDEKASRGPTKS